MNKIDIHIENASIANAYVRRINRGTITIEEVPESIREVVERILDEQEE